MVRVFAVLFLLGFSINHSVGQVSVLKKCFSFSLRGMKEVELMKFDNGNILSSINKSYLNRQRLELTLLDSSGNFLKKGEIELGKKPYLNGSILSVHFFNNALYVALQQGEGNNPIAWRDELYTVNEQLDIRKIDHGEKPFDLSTYPEAFHISPNGKFIQIGSSFFNEKMEHLANAQLIGEEAMPELRSVDYLNGCLLNDGSAVAAYAHAAGTKGDLFNFEVVCKLTKTSIYSGEQKSFDLSPFLKGLYLEDGIIHLYSNDESVTVLLNTYVQGTKVLIINNESFTLTSEVSLNFDYLPKEPQAIAPMRFCIVEVFQVLPGKGFLVGIMPHTTPIERRYSTSLSLSGLYSYAIIDLKGVVQPLISVYRKGLEMGEWHKFRQSARISDGQLHFLALKYSTIMEKMGEATIAEIEINKKVKRANPRLFNATFDINTGKLKYEAIEKTTNIPKNGSKLTGSKDGDFFGLCYYTGNKGFIRVPVHQKSLP